MVVGGWFRLQGFPPPSWPTGPLGGTLGCAGWLSLCRSLARPVAAGLAGWAVGGSWLLLAAGRPLLLAPTKLTFWLLYTFRPFS